MTERLPSLVKSARQSKRDKQARCLRLIQAGRSDAEIIRELAIRRETYWRWKADPKFQAARRLFREQSHEEALRLLSGAEPVAAEYLGKVVADPSAGAVCRIRAAEAVLAVGRETAEADAGGVQDIVMSDDGLTMWFAGKRFELADSEPPLLTLEAHAEGGA